MNGFLLINKPRGATSHDIVAFMRRITGIQKIGHAGTLDPLAEGLLIILIGEATKQQSEFMAGEKEYLAAIRLGASSTTDDAEGYITAMPNDKTQMPNEAQIRECLKNFLGEIEQMPPVYSAIKIRGRKAYELARKGKMPELKPRKVTIREIELLEYSYPLLKLRITCSSGTYIRALARDIGQELKCGAYLEALTRTRSGKFHLEKTSLPQELTSENWQQHLVSK